MSIAPDPQPNLGPYPTPGNTPQAYMTAGQAMAMLDQRWPMFSNVTLGDGDLLVASMALDEEAPFVGVKVAVQQDRQWPRTFKYGWPNYLSTPSPLQVSKAQAGAWYLAYEGVVPQQVLDWVCLEAYRLVVLDQTKVVTVEAIAGASVRYAPGADYPHGLESQLDRRQNALIAPFLDRGGRIVPFISWDDLQ